MIDTCRRRGTELPESMRNAPTLFIGLDKYYDAFWELSTDRDVGMAIGQIPWSVIRKYADYEEWYGEEFEDFLYYMRSMDDVWITYQQEKADAKAKNKEG